MDTIKDQVSLLKESVLDIEDRLFEAQEQIRQALSYISIVLKDAAIISNLDQERK